MKDQQFAAADWLDDNGLPRPGAPMGMLLSAHAALRPDAPAFTFDGETQKLKAVRILDAA